MRWILKTGNLLDEPADVLVCSANAHLTLSGGVGSDLLARFGPRMQIALEQIVRQRSPHFIPRGEVISYSDDSLPYRAVLHAVAIDGWYDSSPAVIQEIVAKCLALAASAGARRVALTALATGFGHLTLAEFSEGIRPLAAQEFPPVEEVCICLFEDYRIHELARHFPESTIAD
jgi:O-acetyl-ADP-ribose deacetylase (regulator of RNase III)